MKNSDLLDIATEDLGLTLDEALNVYALDSVVPGICAECHFVNLQCEPDLRDGHCEDCRKNTVKSILVLAGVI